MAGERSELPSEMDTAQEVSTRNSIATEAIAAQEPLTDGAVESARAPIAQSTETSKSANWNKVGRPTIRTTLGGASRPLGSPFLSSGAHTPVSKTGSATPTGGSTESQQRTAAAAQGNGNNQKLPREDRKHAGSSLVAGEGQRKSGQADRHEAIPQKSHKKAQSHFTGDHLDPDQHGLGQSRDSMADGRDSSSAAESSDIEDDKGVMLNLVRIENSELESGELSEGSDAIGDESAIEDESEAEEDSSDGDDEDEEQEEEYEPPVVDEDASDPMVKYTDSRAVGKHASSSNQANPTPTNKAALQNQHSFSSNGIVAQVNAPHSASLPPLPTSHPPYIPPKEVCDIALAAKMEDGQTCENPKTLGELGFADLKLQVKLYWFHTTADHVPLSAPVVCTSCGQKGHFDSTYAPCTIHTCSTCGEFKSHISSQCPQTRVCQRCRQRGHDDSTCASKLKSTVDQVPCWLCSRPGHWEQNCETLWRAAPYPWESEVPPAHLAVASCFECGQRGHLGNDCPTRRPGKVMGASVFSASKGALPHPTSGREPPIGSREWELGMCLPGPSGMVDGLGRKIRLDLDSGTNKPPPKKRQRGGSSKGQAIQISDDDDESEDDLASRISKAGGASGGSGKKQGGGEPKGGKHKNKNRKKKATKIKINAPGAPDAGANNGNGNGNGGGGSRGGGASRGRGGRGRGGGPGRGGRGGGGSGGLESRIRNTGETRSAKRKRNAARARGGGDGGRGGGNAGGNGGRHVPMPSSGEAAWKRFKS